MPVLATGSAGHLGEGLVRTLQGRQREVEGLDLLDSPFTSHVGSILDHDFVRKCMRGIDVVIHAATLHKPHVATHSRAAFVETNIAETLSVLEAALDCGVAGVVFSYGYLIRHGGGVAGFALVMRGSPASDDPDALDVAEFFVLRRHRRSGVGREAALALWNALPGAWAVRVSEANRAGIPFWSEVIRAYSGGDFVETTRPGNPNPWRVFTFASRASASRAWKRSSQWRWNPIWSRPPGSTTCCTS